MDAIGVKVAFPHQVTIQVGVFLLMFGYYITHAVLSKPWHAYFLAGFIGGSLLMGISILVSQQIELIPAAFLIVAGLFGVYVGTIQSNSVSRIVKHLVNIGGWTFQGTGVFSSLSLTFDFHPPIDVLIFSLNMLVGLLFISWINSRRARE